MTRHRLPTDDERIATLASDLDQMRAKHRENMEEKAKTAETAERRPSAAEFEEAGYEHLGHNHD